MAKKKTDKETEPKKISKNRFTTFFKSETTHFVIGLISVIFSVYLLLAFISFFFTGAADQSILDNQQPGELMQTTNHVKNYAGARGAQLAEFLINECFGIAACFIILFLAVAGMKSLPVPCVEMVYVLFYPARLVLHYTGIYFRRNVQRQFYLPRRAARV